MKTRRVLYVSYDGALDPLGQSQILPYLTRLSAPGMRFTLVTFEKRRAWHCAALRSTVSSALASAGIRWIPLRYHRHPAVLSSLWDMGIGCLRICWAMRRRLRTASSISSS